LRVERLALVNLRLVGNRSGTLIPLEEQLGALEDLRVAGKVDLIGLSNVSEADVTWALESVDVAEIQNGYSIIDRQDDALGDFARRT
jgi:pyridoxine 4-dehydrogenase